MDLLKHGSFVFKNIISGKYNIKEDEPTILSEMTMADGTIKRNYGQMPKTVITVTFGRLNKELYKEYMSHFANNEDVYSYFSPKQQTMLTKKFFVTLPETSILSVTKNHKYDEFTVTLEQCGEVSE